MSSKQAKFLFFIKFISQTPSLNIRRLRMRNPGIFTITMAATLLYLAVQSTAAAPCPCDIYKTGGTPCVAAHSTVRALFESYNGPLYQVRRTSDNAVKDIGVLSPGGFVNTATQDSFLNGKAGTISIIYDQTANHNDLAKSPVVTYLKSGGKEGNATDGKIKVNGHTAYGIYVTGNPNYVGNNYPTVAYRNNKTKGVPTGDQPEAMYMVVDGKRYSSSCCFDYGNAETTGRDDGNGTMEALYWGTDTDWGGKGDGNGPWIAADLEEGMFKCDKGGRNTGTSLVTPSAKSIIATFATAMLKGPSGNHFTLKAGDAQSGKLTTMWDGNRPNKNPPFYPKRLQGAIILGTGGDGSSGGTGTYYEGAMTSGVPSDSVDNAIQANIVAAGYGSATTSVLSYKASFPKAASTFDIHYNTLTPNPIISYTLQNAQSVKLIIVNQQGRQIATIVNSLQSAGNHELVWDVRNIPAGIYIANMAINGNFESTGKVIVSN
jgi:hypothetical protein